MGIKAVSKTCKCCQHPEVDQINARIIAGASSRTVAKEFDVGYKSVLNHAEKHLPRQMVRGQQLEDVAAADRMLEQVHGLYDKAKELIEKADEDQKWAAATGAIKEARACLELTSKLVGLLKSGTTVNIVYNSEFVEVRNRIVEALAPFPQAKKAVVEALEEEEVFDADYEEVNCP